MHHFLYACLALCLFTASACKDKDVPTLPGGILPPVETLPPNTDYKPAFAGQTRVNGIKTQTALNIEVIAEGLSKPWGIISLPDGHLLITEKTGTLRIADQDGQLSNLITGLPAVNSNGQGGLLDIVADPDFQANRMIYWTFSENHPGGTTTTVAKGRLAEAGTHVDNVSILFRAEPAYDGTLHYGGRIIFDKDGHLFVSTGERSDLATRLQAQWLHSTLGKVLHLTKEGNPVNAQPIVDAPGALPEIFTYGHRNVQGLAIHPVTGELWEGEFGPRGGDEINRVSIGKNYGWPIITYGLEYSGEPVGDGITQHEGMEQPVYYWDPVISPSGMIFYTGAEISEWNNNLLIACLSGQHIARLVIIDNKVVAEERLLADQQERFRDLAVGADGIVYAVTDSGKLYKISKQ